MLIHSRHERLSKVTRATLLLSAIAAMVGCAEGGGTIDPGVNSGAQMVGSQAMQDDCAVATDPKVMCPSLPISIEWYQAGSQQKMGTLQGFIGMQAQWAVAAKSQSLGRRVTLFVDSVGIPSGMNGSALQAGGPVFQISGTPSVETSGTLRVTARDLSYCERLKVSQGKQAEVGMCQSQSPVEGVTDQPMSISFTVTKQQNMTTSGQSGGLFSNPATMQVMMGFLSGFMGGTPMGSMFTGAMGNNYMTNGLTYRPPTPAPNPYMPQTGINPYTNQYTTPYRPPTNYPTPSYPNTGLGGSCPPGSTGGS
jgi:hypothetical protein